MSYEVQAKAYYTRVSGMLDSLLQSKSANRRKTDAVAKEAVKIVLERTAAGIDVNGIKFAPYSTSYANFKRGLVKHLKRAAGGRKNSVVAKEYPAWLRATGQMLSALRAEARVSAQGRNLIINVTYKFSENESALIASYHNELGAGRRQVKRQFLGLSRPGSARRRQEEERLFRAWRNA